MGQAGHDGNWRGYEESDLTYQAPSLIGRDFFLVQGVADDVMHFEQSMNLVKALVESNVLFRQQVGSWKTKKLKLLVSNKTMFSQAT